MTGAIKFMYIFLLSSYLQFAVKSFEIQFPAFGKGGEVLTYADAIMTKIMRFFHGFQQIFFVYRHNRLVGKSVVTGARKAG